MIAFDSYEGVTPQQLAEQMADDVRGIGFEPPNTYALKAISEILQRRIELYLQHNHHTEVTEHVSVR